MARSYQFHRIENFPIPPRRGASLKTHTQLTLLTDGDDTAHSEIRFTGESDFPEFLKYFVRHEVVEKRKVRFMQEDRNEVIFVEEFHLYLPPNRKYLFAETAAHYSNELLKRIYLKDSSFSYTLREVDLLKLRKELQGNIRGGWFRNLQIEDVSTAGIFGATVGDSDEWQHYEDSGKLSALVLEFKHKGTWHSTNISSNGAITLYASYSEKDALELVEVINDIVNRFSTELPPKPRKGSKKKE